MYKFVVIWAVSQIINVAPAADPYTGAESGNGSKESTIRIMYKSFKTKPEAEAFMEKAPVYIHKHMHIEDMSESFSK
jgi:hypothetical protein